MSDKTIDFINSICPVLSPVESTRAAARLDAFNKFFADARAWFDSMPPGQRIYPKPYPTKHIPYCIDTQPSNQK